MQMRKFVESEMQKYYFWPQICGFADDIRRKPISYLLYRGYKDNLILLYVCTYVKIVHILKITRLMKHLINYLSTEIQDWSGIYPQN